jgi:hypothetical protein
MSQSDPAPDDSQQEISQAAEQEGIGQGRKAYSKLVERITPSVVEFGDWIFGGLIGFALVVMASLFTIGPVDTAVLIATTAFALTLPLDVAGLFLLRLDQNLARMVYEEEVTQAFREVGLTVGTQVPTSETLKAHHRRRTQIVLRSTLVILVLTALLALTGMTAALWHMAWWIGVAFLAMIMISLIVVAIVAWQAPESAEENEQMGRYREEIIRQVREQFKKKN